MVRFWVKVGEWAVEFWRLVVHVALMRTGEQGAGVCVRVVNLCGPSRFARQSIISFLKSP